MFHHLNLDNEWPRLRCYGLEVDPACGLLSLRKLPGPEQSRGALPGMPLEQPSPAGIVAGAEGELFVVDADAQTIYRQAKPGLPLQPLRCIAKSQSGYGWGQLNQPRGLAYQPCRQRLLVADTGNKRIQVIDTRTERVVDVWGQTWPHDKPVDCSERHGLGGPEELTCDQEENVYVIDRSDAQWRRVIKLDRDGQSQPDFNERLEQLLTGFPQLDPLYLAVGPHPCSSSSRVTNCGCGCSHQGTEDCIYLLAIQLPPLLTILGEYQFSLFILDLEGNPLTTEPVTLWNEQLIQEERHDTSSGSNAVSTILSNVTESVTTLRSLNLFDGDDDFVQKQLRVQQHQRTKVTGFIVMGNQIIVARRVPKNASPPRVWVYHLGEALRALVDNGKVEASWLTLKDSTAVALGIQRDATGRQLLVSGGTGRAVLSLCGDGAFRSQGAFLGGPYTGQRGCVTEWNRLRWEGNLPDGCFVQWFTLSRSDQEGWQAPRRLRLDRLPRWFRFEDGLFSVIGLQERSEQEQDVESREFHPIQRQTQQPVIDLGTVLPNTWHAVPENQFDCFLRNSGGTNRQPADQLWILGVMVGNGEASPTFQQARLEFNEDGWLEDLPEVFVREPRSRLMTRSLLALLQSRFEDVSGEIARLPALFSPVALANRYGPLTQEANWLRRVMALPAILTDGPHSLDRQQLALSHGAQWLALRGAPDGFRRILWLATGVDVVIEEPGRFAFPDVIGQPSSMSDQPAIVPGAFDGGTLGYSILTDPDEPVIHLPADLGYHFIVHGYENDLASPEARQLLESAVNRYAPAHTTWSVQVIRPYARVGIQSRLGIDAVLAMENPADPLTLDEEPGPDFQLHPQPLRPIVGAAHLGSHTPLI